jgi:hypothetical protein
MLELNPDIVCAIISSAREFQAKEQVVIPEPPTNPGDDWALQVLADHGDDLTFQEAKALIDDLEPDQQAALVALMWTGRGDFGVDEWRQAFAQAMDERNDRTAEYLLATPLLPDYLREALAELGYDCSD